MHHKVKLTPRELGFVVGTRVLFGLGVGLLLSGKLSGNARRAIGIGLASLGAVTTIPSLLFVRRGA
jgi:hypothetical protein